MRPDTAPACAVPCADAEVRWQALCDADQIELARAALRFAWHSLADQAEALAGEMDGGALDDQGGAEALRLFGAILRLVSADEPAPQAAALATMTMAGHA